MVRIAYILTNYLGQRDLEDVKLISSEQGVRAIEK